MLIFAYGSNMLTTRLKSRVGSASPVGVACLRGYELRWHKRGKDGSGKCDVVCSQDVSARVHGVVYRINTSEKRALDIAEGLGRGYDEMQVTVDCQGRSLSVQAYVATQTDPTLKPYDWYKAFVVEGAREHGLPRDYVVQLEAVEAVPDADVSRAATNRAILDAARSSASRVRSPASSC